ncbi:hypothetical protein HRbin03_00280 [archaeon HR03]|nr:hypothetical protein HRbin03_00280 [archaeon HR03]
MDKFFSNRLFDVLRKRILLVSDFICYVIKTKRVYEPPSPEDGCRVLVDRLWPRGLGKNRAAVDVWLKEVAPSGSLRKWFGHKPERWEEFKRRFFMELSRQPDGVRKLLELEEKHGTVSLLYSAKDTVHNNATALKEYIEQMKKG